MNVQREQSEDGGANKETWNKKRLGQLKTGCGVVMVVGALPPSSRQSHAYDVKTYSSMDGWRGEGGG